ncbi:UNVERIFIED_CONTAM: hypothetical protein PYX00_009553 [Menopon gallinae]|uniref:Uncharacterized protein n=1 Tax=Menopon gallinae TaxID=328185 RepID=A0AAW2HC15_9NEOP
MRCHTGQLRYVSSTVSTTWMSLSVVNAGIVLEESGLGEDGVDEHARSPRRTQPCIRGLGDSANELPPSCRASFLVALPVLSNESEITDMGHLGQGVIAGLQPEARP